MTALDADAATPTPAPTEAETGAEGGVGAEAAVAADVADRRDAGATPVPGATNSARRGPIADLRGRLAALNIRLGDPSVPVALTLVLVMLGTDDSWYVGVPVVVLTTVGVVVPSVRGSARFWLALAATLGAAAWADRWRTDNHQYLIAYWCLALGLAASSADPARVRRISARLLVGAVFLLATTWKILSPDFVDGSFMRYTLLTDTRFTEVATLVGGVDPGDLTANRDAISALDDPKAALRPVRLRGTDRLDALAHALTWWTLLVEGSVAVAFLVPWRRLGRYRDPLLITFVVTTYAIAPVVGFGWVLVCLGLAQREPTRRMLPLAYLGAFLLVQVFTAPWVSVAGLVP